MPKRKVSTDGATPKKRTKPPLPQATAAPEPQPSESANGESRAVQGKPRSLVVVESPTKARTLKKFLTRRYDVFASMGHLKDLPRSQLGVDVKNGFTPKYIVVKGKGSILKELKEADRKSVV